MENPCYDVFTKTDCCDRHEGCGSKCPKWIEYVKKRNAEYDRKKLESDALAAIDGIHIKRMEARQRELTRKRSNKFNGHKDL